MRPFFDRLNRLCRGLPLQLPIVFLLGVLVWTSLWSVWGDHGRVCHAVLFNMLPPPASATILGLPACAGVFWMARSKTAIAWLRQELSSTGPFLAGWLVGQIPAILYIVKRSSDGQGLEHALPLGLRPLWTTAETLGYLFRGLPVLLGADPNPFLSLVRVGRSYATAPLSESLTAGLAALNWVVLAALVACGLFLVMNYRSELIAVLRVQPGTHSPVAFLLLALCGMVSMYVLGGCTIDFTTIRYLVPLWAVLPGLLAAVAASSRWRIPAITAVAVLLVSWSIGQVGLFVQLGLPHPLSRLARMLQVGGPDFALAEPLDAHLLSFLTEQKPRIGEFQSFWPRLAHYREHLDTAKPISYVVHAADIDWTLDWTLAGWPGDPPPETARFLWPMLKRILAERPDDVLTREPLTDGYELWTLARPVPECKPDGPSLPGK